MVRFFLVKANAIEGGRSFELNRIDGCPVQAENTLPVSFLSSHKIKCSAIYSSTFCTRVLEKLWYSSLKGSLYGLCMKYENLYYNFEPIFVFLNFLFKCRMTKWFLLYENIILVFRFFNFLIVEIIRKSGTI